MGGLGRDKITYTDDDGKEQTLTNKGISCEYVYKFFTERFQTTYVNEDSGLPDAWVIRDNNTCEHKGGVRYWQDLRKIMAKILGVEGDNSVSTTRKLMRHVLSAEIVPFGSQEERGVTDSVLESCWGSYAVPLLKNCGAEIIFLVGVKTQEIFGKLALPEGHKDIENGKVYPDEKLNIEGADGQPRKFHIALIDAPNKRGDKNYNAVCDDLLKNKEVKAIIEELK